MFGMHPAMASLQPFWNAGTFGVVHAVGMEQPNRSHFEAMEEMERAAPGTSVRTGWIDRVLGLREPGTAFQATQMGIEHRRLRVPRAQPRARDVVGRLLQPRRRRTTRRAGAVGRGPARRCTRGRPTSWPTRRPPRWTPSPTRPRCRGRRVHARQRRRLPQHRPGQRPEGHRAADQGGRRPPGGRRRLRRLGHARRHGHLRHGVDARSPHRALRLDRGVRDRPGQHGVAGRDARLAHGVRPPRRGERLRWRGPRLRSGGADAGRRRSRVARSTACGPASPRRT